MVQDVPLLVETGSPAAFALVVVVHADAETRVRRLVEARGMSEADARARIAAQAADDARRAAADVVLDNAGPPEALEAAVDELWHRRLVPFEANLRSRRPVLPPPRQPVEPDPRVGRGRRPARRPGGPGGRDAGRATSRTSGPTAVPGLPAVDVLDLQVAVDPAAPRSRHGPGRARRRRVPAIDGRPSTAGEWWHAGADPGRPVRVHGCGRRVAGVAGGAAAARLAASRRRGAGERIRSASCPARTGRRSGAVGGVRRHPSGGLGRIVGVDAVVGRGTVRAPT